jgi:hypothetical protein
LRVLGYLLALLVGFALWGISLAFGGGVAPLGKTGPAEGALFFVPIVAFAAPLAVVAFVRGHALTGSWIVAVAPVFGLLNFALAVSAKMAQSSPLAVRLSEPSTLLLVWLLLLALALGALALFGRVSQRTSSSDA